MTDINRTLNSTAAVGKIFYLADGTIQSCNPNACSILGYSCEQLMETSFFELPWRTISENDSKFLLKTPSIEVMPSIEIQPSHNALMGFCQPSGDSIELSVNIIPLCKTDNNELYGVEISFISLTQGKKASIKAEPQNPGYRQLISHTSKNINGRQKKITLLESEQRLKLATDASGIGMWFWDTIENVVEWTELGKAIFGVPPGKELNLEKCFKIIHPEDRHLVQSRLEQALAERSQYSIEYRVVRADGSVRWIVARGRGVYNQKGEPISMMGTVQDISDRKKNEAALERSKQALEQRERELKSIVEIIPQQIWTAREDGRIDYVNQRSQNYTGLNFGQMEGLGWSVIVHPEDFPTIRKSWIRSSQTGEKFDIETRLRDANGTYRWFLAKARPLRNERGKIIKWYGTNTNINRIKELEQKLRQQTKDLIQVNQLKDDFLAIVSHELRTPLNPILGWSQLLANGKLDSDRTSQGIGIIERNAKLQAQLINDLLDVSSILRGKLELNTTPINLESVIRSAISTVQLAASAKSIAIETIFESNIGQVLGDIGRLQQIINNLVVNAIKFTSTNGRVFVKLKKAGTQAVIEIRDTGKGIEPQFIPYVFDRFRQENSTKTREFGGLGLGLAIVKHLTELHGGEVAVSSPGLNKGATFSVKLPLMNISISEPVEINPRDRAVQPNRFSGLTILVVDDEIDSLDILTLVLQSEGAEVISVASASAALEVFSQTTPDLIVSDIGMPDTDGYTLIEEVRKLPQGQNIPAIALTAYAGEIDMQQSLDAGFQRHLSKPIIVPQLIDTIIELL